MRTWWFDIIKPTGNDASAKHAFLTAVALCPPLEREIATVLELGPLIIVDVA